jgi:hypothetical protein
MRRRPPLLPPPVQPLNGKCHRAKPPTHAPRHLHLLRAYPGRENPMTDVPFPQLLDIIRASQSAYYKLTILSGGVRAGKTHLLKQVATQLDLPLINLGLLLSQRLLGQSRANVAW